jgi:hypothetical protein
MLVLTAPDRLWWAIAILASAAILLPALLFAIAPVRLRERIEADPALAEPPPDDPDYQLRFRQFAALGFRPLGRTFQTCWFMSPVRLYWRSLQGERWLADRERLTFVSFHRLVRREPVRFGVVSYLPGGGLARTTCPGVMGRIVDDEDALYWRTELRNVEPEQLLRRHEASLAAISARRKLSPKRMTLEEISATELFHAKRLVGRSGRSGYSLIFAAFVGPVLLSAFYACFVTPALMGHARSGLRSPLHLTLTICIGASLFAFVRLVMMPLNRRRAVLRSHAQE